MASDDREGESPGEPRMSKSARLCGSLAFPPIGISVGLRGGLFSRVRDSLPRLIAEGPPKDEQQDAFQGSAEKAQGGTGSAKAGRGEIRPDWHPASAFHLELGVLLVCLGLREQKLNRKGGRIATERNQWMTQPISIMPCLDMQNGRVVKGVHFVNIRDAGDPVECAQAYCQAGADELALLDITATVEGRRTMLDVVRRVAAVTTVPFTVGGGISDLSTAAAVFEAGADKVSTSSAAFRKPQLIAEMVREFGPQRVTVAIDVDRNPALPSGYEVYIDGGRTATGTDAIEWAKKVDSYGVAVILPTSKAGDGARTGYDLPVIRAMKEATSAQIVASGGAGKLEHFYEAVEAGATILLAASVFHFQIIRIPELKQYLRSRGVTLRGSD